MLLWLGCVGQANAAPTTITEFSNGLSGYPHHIVAGPDGNLWFSVYREEVPRETSGAIGRIEPDGTITEFSQGLIGTPTEIVAGPDGNLWFGANSPPGIGRISTTGEITMFSGMRVRTNPNELAVGAEGDIWFASPGGGRPAVGSITAAGKISQFDLPAYPREIIAGPDGNMWMTYGYLETAAIGRIASHENGTTITLFRKGLGEESNPADIVVGPDGNLWFIDPFSLGQITTEGLITRFYFPGSGRARSPNRIASGPDGNLWLTAPQDLGPTSSIGRVTPSGSMTEFLDGLNAGSQPHEIVVGPDSNLWFTDGGATYAIGRIVPGEDEQATQTWPSSAQGPSPRNDSPGRLELAGKIIRVFMGHATFAPSCVGGSRCAGRLTLTVKQWRKGKSPGSIQRVIGTTLFSIPGSVRAPVEIKLNARGRRFLRRHNGRLPAKLTALGPTSTMLSKQRIDIRLVLPPRLRTPVGRGR